MTDTEVFCFELNFMSNYTHLSKLVFDLNFIYRWFGHKPDTLSSFIINRLMISILLFSPSLSKYFCTNTGMTSDFDSRSVPTPTVNFVWTSRGKSDSGRQTRIFARAQILTKLMQTCVSQSRIRAKCLWQSEWVLS